MEPVDKGETGETRRDFDHIPGEFGQRIKAARKARDLSVADLAHHLNLTASALNAIEAGNWHELGPLVYVRGYVRSCARELSISDSDTDGWFRVSEIEQQSNERATILSPARPSRLHRSHRMVAYAAATALLAIPATWLVMQAFDSDPRGNPVEVAETAPAPARSDARLASIAVLPPRNRTAPPLETVEPEPAPAPTLMLRFSQEAWLEARTLGGERLAYGLVASGAERSLPTDRGLSVRLGNPDAVQASLDGQPFDLSQHAKKDLAEFRLEPPQ